MLAFVTGTIVDAEENNLIVEHKGIGFQIFVPTTVIHQVSIGQIVRLFTHMNVKEDDISLYGFLSKDDLKVYRLLLNVNGIGPKAALGVLSALSADELRFAVLSDDVASISKAPGIGKKTAQKLILELKDKFNLEDAFEQKLLNNNSQGLNTVHVDNSNTSEVIEALVALGYSAGDALRAVKKVENSHEMTVEQLLKATLKCL